VFSFLELFRRLEKHEHLVRALRLAVRELGLVIGLRALDPMRATIWRRRERFNDSAKLLARIESMARHASLIENIERFWLEPSNQGVAAWTEHRDINSVMLATSLVPETYLMSESESVDGERQLSGRPRELEK